MTNLNNATGNYGVPDAEYVNEFGNLELHYQWFTSSDDAIEYATQLNYGPDPFDWCAIDGIITIDV